MVRLQILLDDGSIVVQLVKGGCDVETVWGLIQWSSNVGRGWNELSYYIER
jgi:hypothetical protein